MSELMVKQNLLQVQMLLYLFDTSSFSKAVVGYGIKLHSSGRLEQEHLSQRPSLRLLVPANEEDKRLSFQKKIIIFCSS